MYRIAETFLWCFILIIMAVTVLPDLYNKCSMIEWVVILWLYINTFFWRVVCYLVATEYLILRKNK